MKVQLRIFLAMIYFIKVIRNITQLKGNSLKLNSEQFLMWKWSET